MTEVILILFFKKKKKKKIFYLIKAVLGTTLKIKTLNGEKEIEIKPGTQHGEKIRIKGQVKTWEYLSNKKKNKKKQGVCNLPPNSNVVGDHIVNLKVHIPKTISKE